MGQVKLPHAETSRVEREKITEYLLSLTHPDGRSKGEFLREFGFRLESWETLQEALRKHGANNPVVSVVESRYGVRYISRGSIGDSRRTQPAGENGMGDRKGKRRGQADNSVPQ